MHYMHKRPGGAAVIRVFRRIIAAGLAACAVSLPAHAASGFITAKPTSYTAAADSIGGGTVYLSNVNINMGLCTGSYVSTSTDKRLRFYATENGNHMRAIVLSSILAGKAVTIGWDDAHRDENNVCYIRSVAIAG
jgi:hypothetical protein